MLRCYDVTFSCYVFLLLFTRTDLEPCTESSFSVKLPAHATRIYRLEADERTERTEYEAECAWLSDFSKTGKNDVAGAAKCSGSSCGYKVGWLVRRPENDLQWQDIYIKEDGKYRLTVYFLAKEERKFFYQVNGGTVKNATVSSGDWDRVSSRSFQIGLHEGWNTIRLFNNTAWMPDIDRISLKRTSPTDIETTTEDAVPVIRQTTDLQGRPIPDPQTLRKGTFYIEDGQKKMR